MSCFYQKYNQCSEKKILRKLTEYIKYKSIKIVWNFPVQVILKWCRYSNIITILWHHILINCISFLYAFQFSLFRFSLQEHSELSEHLCPTFHHAGQIQTFLNFPCWLSVICWYKFTFHFQKIAYIILIHCLAKDYLVFLIICQTQLPRTQPETQAHKNRHLTNDMGGYKKNHVFKSQH